MPDHPRTSRVGKTPLERQPGCHQYARISDERGVALSLHEASKDLFPGQFWLSSGNSYGDYRPARLDVAQVRALRDACDLLLADHGPTPTPETTADEVRPTTDPN